MLYIFKDVVVYQNTFSPNKDNLFEKIEFLFGGKRYIEVWKEGIRGKKKINTEQAINTSYHRSFYANAA